MDRRARHFVMWTTLAGILFIIVGVHDVSSLDAAGKSVFVIVLELTAGLCFLLNAFLSWRKAVIASASHRTDAGR